MSESQCCCLYLNPCGVGRVVGITFPRVRLLILALVGYKCIVAFLDEVYGKRPNYHTNRANEDGINRILFSLSRCIMEKCNQTM